MLGRLCIVVECLATSEFSVTAVRYTVDSCNDFVACNRYM